MKKKIFKTIYKKYQKLNIFNVDGSTSNPDEYFIQIITFPFY